MIVGSWIGAIALCSACGPNPPEIEFEPRSFHKEDGGRLEGEFGFLAVPERHERPEGSLIRLAVARFQATDGSAGPPIIYLEGGPGGPGIHPERFPLLERLRAFGDVVTFDQRGSGASLPLLNCPEGQHVPAEIPRTRQVLLRAEQAAARTCAKDIKERGIDLGAYNVYQSTADIEAIRRSLGVRRVRLVGISFGSHLALAFMQRYPDRVERAVLAGVEGLHHTVKRPLAMDRHLHRISDLIAADPVAGPLLPDFAGLVRRTLQQLDQEPQRVSLPQEEDVLMTSFSFRRLVVGSIVRRQFLESVLLEFGPVRQGDLRVLAGLVNGPARIRPFAMRAAMDCASGPSPQRLQHLLAERESALLQGVADFPFPEVCQSWGIEPLGGRLWEEMRFDGPVQFITGTLDGLTPISNVEELGPGIPNSGHLIIERIGHEGPGIWFASPEVLEQVGDFLSGGPPRDITTSAPPIRWHRNQQP